MKKVLVISNRNIESLFSHLQSDYQIIHCKTEDALVNLATEEPSVIFCIAEHQGDGFKKAYEAYQDVKRSITDEVTLIRLGFLPKKSGDGDIYLQLPAKSDEIRACIELAPTGVLERLKRE